VQSQGRLEDVFTGGSRGALEGRLGAYVVARRWFRSKTRKVRGVSLDRVLPLPGEVKDVALAVARVGFEQGPDERYVLPLAWIHGEPGEHLTRTRPDLVIGAVDVQGEERPRWLVDAVGDRHALEGLYTLFARAAVVRAGGAELVFRAVGGGFDRFAAEDVEPRPVQAEQSNTSVVFGTSSVVKIVRKLEEGTPADVEMGELLTRAGYAHAPRLLAVAELRQPGVEAAAVATAHAFVANEGDAWPYTLAKLSSLAKDAEGGPRASDKRAAEAHGAAFASTLALRVAELHRILAAPTGDGRFAPEPIERPEREAIARAVRRSLDEAWARLGDPGPRLPPAVLERLGAVRRRASDFDDLVARFVAAEGLCVKTRVHGDLHLGQVLVAGGDLVLIDFEGEPGRPLADRKAKRSPLVDVAGVLRSLHYAAIAASRARPDAGASAAAMRRTADAWHAAARRAFLTAYFDAASRGSVVPADPAARATLLRFYLLEKCIYELHYELGSRPDWAMIPVMGLERILEDLDAG
jgi:trehalose synthase-fused probable maltokinase